MHWYRLLVCVLFMLSCVMKRNKRTEVVGSRRPSAGAVGGMDDHAVPVWIRLDGLLSCSSRVYVCMSLFSLRHIGSRDLGVARQVEVVLHAFLGVHLH